MREGGGTGARKRGGPAQVERLDQECRRLLWRSRRGMKELDILLEHYVRTRLPAAPADQRRAFERLLELPDPVLADYLLGQECPMEPQVAQLAWSIRALRL